MGINRTSYEERERLSEVLLRNIKANLPPVEALADRFNKDETELLYRFYHWSFKCFRRQQDIREALALFATLAPENRGLNGWYRSIVDEALGREFDNRTTNDNWVAEVLPVITGWQHTRVFLNALARSGAELESPGQVLPDFWALTLYLYDCR